MPEGAPAGVDDIDRMTDNEDVGMGAIGQAKIPRPDGRLPISRVGDGDIDIHNLHRGIGGQGADVQALDGEGERAEGRARRWGA